MYRNKSDYALNKLDPDAIVYRDASGNIKRLTRNDFDSEEEFLRWKVWSDEEYHNEEKKEIVESLHSIPIDSVSEEELSSPSEEQRATISEAESERNEEVKCLLYVIRDLLTEKQFRRLWMKNVDGFSEAQIAHAEGITQQNVSKSINAALKTICEHFGMPLKRGCKNG